jgi:DNA-binding NarL/FixJ family response regulator
MNIFIADNSDSVRLRISELLSEFPQVEIIGQARNTIEALTKLEHLHPDLLILDIRMPGGSGLDILRKVKAEKNGTTVIMLTNAPFPQYKKVCRQLGADFLLNKSFELKNMTEILRRLVKIEGILQQK